jgi:hypothetical protein
MQSGRGGADGRIESVDGIPSAVKPREIPPAEG